jgi:hypothetical protein
MFMPVTAAEFPRTLCPPCVRVCLSHSLPACLHACQPQPTSQDLSLWTLSVWTLSVWTLSGWTLSVWTLSVWTLSVWILPAWTLSAWTLPARTLSGWILVWTLTAWTHSCLSACLHVCLSAKKEMETGDTETGSRPTVSTQTEKCLAQVSHA